MLLEIQKAVRKKAPKDNWDDMNMISGATGDILYAHEYIEKVIPKKDYSLKNVVLLPSNYGNVYGWKSLRYYVDSKSIVELMEESNYSCPFTDGNAYFWNIPVGILYSSKENFEWYKNILETHDKVQAEFVFADYMLENSRVDGFFGLNSIQIAMLGHGYTGGTMPCDGGGEIVYTYMPLSNGDKLICASWEWFNK